MARAYEVPVEHASVMRACCIQLAGRRRHHDGMTHVDPASGHRAKAGPDRRTTGRIAAMHALRTTAAAGGGFLFLCVRGILLWFFLVPSLLAWLIGLATWPVLRPFGVRSPLGPRYYSRWATYLLDGLLTRLTPLPRSPWPWQVDVRASRISSWNDAFDWF
jgi:hypothetical protein